MIPAIFVAHGAPMLLDDPPWVAELGAWGRALPLLAAAGIASSDAPSRGLDHGVYVPLLCMYPQADIPVLQLSLPSLEPRELYALGQALAPLAAEDVLVAGSGFLTHDLRSLSLRHTPKWALDFDAWCADVLARRDLDALLDYRARAPGVREALPTHEHFAPVIVAAGAGASLSPVTFPITGFWFGGSFTRRSVQWG